MKNNSVFIDKERLKLLKEIDAWLSKETFNSDSEAETAIGVRTLISKIQKKGYYYEDEADFLNLMREEYIKNKKKNKK